MGAGSLARRPTSDALLLLARNPDAILKVNASTGAVVWQLGGRDGSFALGPDAAPRHPPSAE